MPRPPAPSILPHLGPAPTTMKKTDRMNTTALETTGRWTTSSTSAGSSLSSRCCFSSSPVSFFCGRTRRNLGTTIVVVVVVFSGGAWSRGAGVVGTCLLYVHVCRTFVSPWCVLLLTLLYSLISVHSPAFRKTFTSLRWLRPRKELRANFCQFLSASSYTYVRPPPCLRSCCLSRNQVWAVLRSEQLDRGQPQFLHNGRGVLGQVGRGGRPTPSRHTRSQRTTKCVFQRDRNRNSK